VRTPDINRASALLDGRVERRDGDRLLVADADPAEVNARLVAAGLRVSEIGPERRSLEDLMLSVTGSGSDRIDATGRDSAKPEAAGPGAAEPGTAGQGGAEP
jgi:hypothetical protein